MGSELVSGGLYCSLMCVLIFYLREPSGIISEAEGMQLNGRILQSNSKYHTLNY